LRAAPDCVWYDGKGEILVEVQHRIIAILGARPYHKANSVEIDEIGLSRLLR
jgi:hypothetical protein